MKKSDCIFLFGLLLTACTARNIAADDGGVATVLPDETTEVRAMRLEYTRFQDELIANGTVVAPKADVRFKTSEYIVAIYVKNGDRVAKGQPLAMIDPFTLQHDLAQAKDNLAHASLDLRDAIITQGYMHGDTSKVPAEIRQIAKLRSNYTQRLNQYELAEYNCRNATLRAPFDGVVANLFTGVYNYSSAAEPFCTVIANARDVDFKILESEWPFVHIGDRVRVAPYALDDQVTEGRIVEINPAVDKNGMVRVKACLDGSRLYDGMNVKIRIRRSLDNRLVIPKEALVLRTGKKVVFTLKNGRAQWVYVQTGLENSSEYVVTEGLAPGDSVIYEGNINLANDAPVRLVDAPSSRERRGVDEPFAPPQ